jgi:hypothetical protein
MSREILEAMHALAREKGISAEKLIAALEDALLSAYKKQPGSAKYARVELDPDTGDYRVIELIIPERLEAHLIVETIDEGTTYDPETGEMVEPTDPEIDPAKFEQYKDQIDERDVTPDDFGRIEGEAFGGVPLNAEMKLEVWDSDFPTDRTVYQESTGPLGGLAGESRSGDANGQWFRVLVAPSNYAYPAGSNFFLTGQPLKGVNPPPPAQRYPRPYKPDVPCETQQAPDLRSNPIQPPQATKIDLTSSAVQALNSAMTNKTIAMLKKQANLDNTPLHITDNPIQSLSDVKK